MEIVIFVALGIVLGFVLLALLDVIVVSLLWVIGCGLALAAVICVIALGVEWLKIVFSSPWNVAAFSLLIGGILIAYFYVRVNGKGSERQKELFEEFCATRKFSEVFGTDIFRGVGDLTITERSAQLDGCSYELQVRIFHQWVAVDGGESLKVVEAKANKLNEAAATGEVAGEIQGARIVSAKSEQQSFTVREFHFPDRWNFTRANRT